MEAGRHQGRPVGGNTPWETAKGPWAWSSVGYLGQPAQGLRVAQVSARLSRGLGSQAAREAQDLGRDMEDDSVRPSPQAHPHL